MERRGAIKWEEDALRKFYKAYHKHGPNWSKVAKDVGAGKTAELCEALHKQHQSFLNLPNQPQLEVAFVAMVNDLYNHSFEEGQSADVRGATASQDLVDAGPGPSSLNGDAGAGALQRARRTPKPKLLPGDDDSPRRQAPPARKPNQETPKSAKAGKAAPGGSPQSDGWGSAKKRSRKLFNESAGGADHHHDDVGEGVDALLSLASLGGQSQQETNPNASAAENEDSRGQGASIGGRAGGGQDEGNTPKRARTGAGPGRARSGTPSGTPSKRAAAAAAAAASAAAAPAATTTAAAALRSPTAQRPGGRGPGKARKEGPMSPPAPHSGTTSGLAHSTLAEEAAPMSPVRSARKRKPPGSMGVQQPASHTPMDDDTAALTALPEDLTNLPTSITPTPEQLAAAVQAIASMAQQEILSSTAALLASGALPAQVPPIKTGGRGPGAGAAAGMGRAGGRRAGGRRGAGTEQGAGPSRGGAAAGQDASGRPPVDQDTMLLAMQTAFPLYDPQMLMSMLPHLQSYMQLIQGAQQQQQQLQQQQQQQQQGPPAAAAPQPAPSGRSSRGAAAAPAGGAAAASGGGGSSARAGAAAARPAPAPLAIPPRARRRKPAPERQHTSMLAMKCFMQRSGSQGSIPPPSTGGAAAPGAAAPTTAGPGAAAAAAGPSASGPAAGRGSDAGAGADSAAADALPQAAAKELRSCLSARVRRWCMYEFLYSAIDRPWFLRNELQEFAQALGLPTSKLTRTEWSVLRGALGKPRRFSLSFLRDERTRLEGCREHVRRKYEEVGVGMEVPPELPRPLRVGQRVTARHPITRAMHDGHILTVKGNKYRVQFERSELLTEVVRDVDVMPVDPNECLPLQLPWLPPLLNGRSSEALRAIVRMGPGIGSLLLLEPSPSLEPQATESDSELVLEVQRALAVKAGLVARLKQLNDEAANGLHTDQLGGRTEDFQLQYTNVVLQLKETNAALEGVLARLHGRQQAIAAATQRNASMVAQQAAALMAAGAAVAAAAAATPSPPAAMAAAVKAEPGAAGAAVHGAAAAQAQGAGEPGAGAVGPSMLVAQSPAASLPMVSSPFSAGTPGVNCAVLTPAGAPLAGGAVGLATQLAQGALGGLQQAQLLHLQGRQLLAPLGSPPQLTASAPHLVSHALAEARMVVEACRGRTAMDGPSPQPPSQAATPPHAPAATPSGAPADAAPAAVAASAPVPAAGADGMAAATAIAHADGRSAPAASTSAGVGMSPSDALLQEVITGCVGVLFTLQKVTVGGVHPGLISEALDLVIRSMRPKADANSGLFTEIVAALRGLKAHLTRAQ